MKWNTRPGDPACWSGCCAPVDIAFADGSEMTMAMISSEYSALFDQPTELCPVRSSLDLHSLAWNNGVIEKAADGTSAVQRVPYAAPRVIFRSRPFLRRGLSSSPASFST